MSEILMSNEILIMKTLFGSHLYGTSSDKSDIDIKGIFIPDKEDILLGRIPHQRSYKRNKKEGEKNTSDDVDIEIFSLHEFIKLACEGQTIALDMLHTTKEMLFNENTQCTEIWDEIVKNRSKFYTKNLQAFIGYAQRQAAKYGVKGSRLAAAREFYELLQKYKSVGNVYDLKLKDIWNHIKTGEHINFIGRDANGTELVQVCGKIFQETSTISYVLPIIEKYYNNYGERARLAELNEGIDWKAVSHAIRAAFEIKELLIDKTITFPLKEAELVKKIKYGQMDYMTEVSPLFESLIDECKELSKKSDLPENVDRKFWNDFIVNVLEKYVL